MSAKQIVVIFSACILVCACLQPQEVPFTTEFAFTSPKIGWVYYDDSKILLALNIDTQDIDWESSVDGFLGVGNHLLTFLSVGEHTLSARVGGITKTAQVHIYERFTGNETKILINRSSVDKLLKPNKYFPYIVTLDGSVSGISAEYAAVQKPSQTQRQDGLLRDIHLAPPKPYRRCLRQTRHIPSIIQRCPKNRRYADVLCYQYRRPAFGSARVCSRIVLRFGYDRSMGSRIR
jgi:hypothetical protein